MVPFSSAEIRAVKLFQLERMSFYTNEQCQKTLNTSTGLARGFDGPWQDVEDSNPKSDCSNPDK